MLKYALIPLLFLTGCGSTVVQDRPTKVSVPVTVPCVSGVRPEAVASLKELHPDWDKYSFKQKTEYFAVWALQNRNYGQGLASATGACK